jgi:predicted metal-dependent phosphoesterase TrpH
VGELRAKKVSIASLTDHDTVDGVNSFLTQCRKVSIKAVPGVELSAAYDGVLHILGYRFDAENKALRDALAQNRKARKVRNVLICEKLRLLGFDITFEEVASYAGTDVVGRPHIAQVLWNKGYVPNVKAAFDRYLKRGAEAYVSRALLSPEECIRLIREAGGLAVLAHPRQTTPDLDDLPRVLSRLKNNGLWGLECWSPGNDTTEIYRCLEIAASFSLAPTAGSDFHGNGHSSASVGVIVGEDLLPWSHLCGGL